MRYRPECPLPRPDRHSSCQTGLPLQLASKKTNHGRPEDRKSTRLNSSHDQISYAVFCLKKKKKQPPPQGRLRLNDCNANVALGARLPAMLYIATGTFKRHESLTISRGATTVGWSAHVH